MEPEKFENKIKALLEEREIKPSSEGWSRLEQRLEKKKKVTKPYLLWIGSAAAVAIIFFTLGTYFNAPIASEEPQVVEQAIEEPVLEEKIPEPEVIQLATSEGEGEVESSETGKKSSGRTPSKKAIFETPIRNASEENNLVASEISSEATEVVKPKSESLLAEHKPELSQPNIPLKVSDIEVEALLLLASAELKSDPAFTVDSRDLLHQVEYELDQSFRQKVFEVVKEGLSKAKTAVANQDF